MAKVYGLQGKAKGKLGSVVYSINAGTMIGREYNPNVANPNTSAQVDQRAKLKLMSQIAASMAPVIAIPKDGMRSARNQFIAKNFDLVNVYNGQANVDVTKLQITNGSTSFPTYISISRGEGDSDVRVTYGDDAPEGIDRIILVGFAINDNKQLVYQSSEIVERGSNGAFNAASLNIALGKAVVYAYGITDKNEAARTKYNNYGITNAVQVASLVASRSFTTSDEVLTKSVGVLLDGEGDSDSPSGRELVITVTTQGHGSATGGGIVEENSDVTLTATPQEGWSLGGFYDLNNGNRLLASTSPYTFRAVRDMDILAEFEIS